MISSSDKLFHEKILSKHEKQINYNTSEVLIITIMFENNLLHMCYGLLSRCKKQRIHLPSLLYILINM